MHLLYVPSDLHEQISRSAHASWPLGVRVGAKSGQTSDDEGTATDSTSTVPSFRTSVQDKPLPQSPISQLVVNAQRSRSMILLDTRRPKSNEAT